MNDNLSIYIKKVMDKKNRDKCKFNYMNWNILWIVTTGEVSIQYWIKDKYSRYYQQNYELGQLTYPKYNIWGRHWTTIEIKKYQKYGNNKIIIYEQQVNWKNFFGTEQHRMSIITKEVCTPYLFVSNHEQKVSSQS